VDFLLECIGFPPEYDLAELASTVERRGEPCPWRGPPDRHLRLALGAGLEVRLDREPDAPERFWPHYESSHRLRVAVQSVRALPDTAYDVLLHGTANPPLPDAGSRADVQLEALREDYPLAAVLTDARRLRSEPPPGHVLAVSLAGFSLDVAYLGPDEGIRDPYVRGEPRGAALLPTGDPERPGGCMDLSLRIRSLRRTENPLTGCAVDVLEADAPGRPLELFLSRWMVEEGGFDPPRPGWRVEGAFQFYGRVAGGLPRRAAALPRDFG